MYILSIEACEKLLEAGIRLIINDGKVIRLVREETEEEVRI